MFVATAGYVGYVPFAPGTFGSAVGVAIYLALRLADSVALEAAALVTALVLGIWAADVAERQLGKDPHPVVVDEVLGMLVTVAFLDVTFAGVVAGFLLFRLFDVLKPWPAARLEHLHGGPGVMLDDAMAGVYSHLALRGLIWMFPGWLA
jgi:phosphatidylglycerophosphatase A